MMEALSCLSGIERLAPIVNTRYGLLETVGVPIAVCVCIRDGKIFGQTLCVSSVLTITECALVCLRKNGSKGLGFGSMIGLRLFTVLCYKTHDYYTNQDDHRNPFILGVYATVGVIALRCLHVAVNRNASWFLV